METIRRGHEGISHYWVVVAQLCAFLVQLFSECWEYLKFGKITYLVHFLLLLLVKQTILQFNLGIFAVWNELW